MASAVIQYGFMHCNPQSEWACVRIWYQKALPGSIALPSTDIRSKVATIQEVWPLAPLNTITAQLRGSTCFICLVICNRYSQLPLHPEDQHIHSFITPDDVFTRP